MQDNASPSPFRRFPWAQLAFCLACLAMCGYLWMRYSYAWRVYPQHMSHKAASGWLRQRYVSFDGVVHGPWRIGEHRGLLVIGTRIGPAPRILVERSGSALTWSPEKGRLQHFQGRVWPAESHPGNADIGNVGGYPRYGDTVVDTTASRFHGASVAGIVVGAMGCFIFGLYLKRWLRERTAT